MKSALTFVLGGHLMLGTAFAAGIETSPPSLEVSTTSSHQVSSASSESPYSTSSGMPEDTSAGAVAPASSISSHTAVERDPSAESHDNISEAVRMILAGDPEGHKKWLEDVISTLIKVSSDGSTDTSPIDAYWNAPIIIDSLGQSLKIANNVRKEHEAKLRGLKQERKD